MLTATQVRFAYPGGAVMTFPDMALKADDRLLVLGRSGSGKSTLLSLLAGLLQPQQGHIIINGTDMACLGTRARERFRGQKIGLVLQQPHLIQALSVLENLLVVPLLADAKSDRAWAMQLLAQLGLDQLTEEKPGRLSQGQRQRVGIARALVLKPALVLADEPTSALDDAACAAVMAVLGGMTRDAGAQLVVATHDARIRPFFNQVLDLDAWRADA